MALYANQYTYRTIPVFFYAGDRREPVHTHVQRDNAEAKFWLGPVRLGWNNGFSSTELRKLERITEENEQKLMEAWNEYFGFNE